MNDIEFHEMERKKEEIMNDVCKWLLKEIQEDRGKVYFSSNDQYLYFSPTKFASGWVVRYRIETATYYMVCDSLYNLIVGTLGYDSYYYDELSVWHTFKPPQEFIDHFPFLVMQEMK